MTLSTAPIREVLRVDERKPPPIRPQGPALSERSDGRRVAACRTSDQTWEAWRPPSGDCGPRSAERHHVRSRHRLSVACHAEGSATAQHRPRLSPALGLRRNIGENPRCALRFLSRPNRAGGQPDCLRDRQPERQERRKRGPRSIRRATMRARKSKARSVTSWSIRWA